MMNNAIILQYLSELEKNNDRDWYHAHKDMLHSATEEFENVIQALIYEVGRADAAQVCLSHSYNTHDMKDDMAVCDISTEQYNDLVNALNECVYDEYDLLIQLCDSIAMAEGVVDICERMSDIKKRYGSYPQAKWDRNLELLEYFSKKVNGNLYEICRR